MSHDLRDLLAREANSVEIKPLDAARVHESARRHSQRQRVFAVVVSLSITVLIVIGLVAVSAPRTSVRHPAQTGGGTVALEGQFVSIASNGETLGVLTCTASCSRFGAAGALTGLNATTGDVLWATPIDAPGVVAIDGQSAFTTGFDNSTVTKIAISSGTVEASVELHLTHPIAGDPAFLPTDSFAADGALWVMSVRGEVVKIDEQTMTVASTIQIPHEASGGIAVLDGTVWVGDTGTGIVGFDAVSGQQRSTIQIPNDDRLLAVNDLTSTADRIVASGTWAKPTPNGNDLVLTNEAGAAIINPVDGEVVATPVDLGATLLNSAGSTWVSGRTGELYSVTGAGLTKEASLQGKVVAVTATDYWILTSDHALSWVPR
jgi:hypothetical protein